MLKNRRLLQSNLKIRLTAWYSLLLTATLGLFCSYLYWQLGKSLLKQLDTNLKVTASEILRTRAQENQHPVFEPTLHSQDSVGNFGKAGIAARLIADNGQVWDEIGIHQVLPQILPQKAGYLNLNSQNYTWRVYSEPLSFNHEKGWLQVAQSLEAISESQEHLLTVMLLGLPITLVSSSLGGFLLANRSLLPIEKIISTAESIRSDEIERRINYRGSFDEVGRLAMTLDRMFERIQAAFENERRFTADVSHELRTPLAVIKGRLGVTLSRERTTADYQNTLKELDQEVDRLIRLTNGLLLLTRLEQESFAAEPVSVTNLLEILVESLQTLAAEKNITLIEHLEPNLFILGHSDYLTSLFLNLLHNALQYTPENGEVNLEAWQRKQKVYITVTNSGPGIPTEALPHLFKRFYRLESHRSRHTGGAGLGLAIASEIVRLHHGMITVDSQPQQFTRFTIYFPVLED